MATYTPLQVGRKVFCLQGVQSFEEGNASLSVILDKGDNDTEESTIVYNYPPEMEEVVQELAKVVPVHMCGFEDGLLADARTAWGYVCPCSRY